MSTSTIRECLEIYTTFFKIGAITFGGGYSMLPILEHEVERKKGWTTKQEILDYFAIGQSLPGIIAINISCFVGSKRKGLPGAVCAALGMITPSVITISLIAAFISNFADHPMVQKALFGMNLAVAALLLQSVITMVKKVVIDPVTAVLAVFSFATAAFFGLHSVVLLVVGVTAGLIMKWRPRRDISGKGVEK